MNKIVSKVKAQLTEKKEKDGEKAGNSKCPGRPRRAESLGRAKEKGDLVRFMSESQIPVRTSQKRRLSDQDGGTSLKRTAINLNDKSGAKEAAMPAKEMKMKEFEERISGMEREMMKWKKEREEELKAKLKEKDEVIGKLVERVEQLEGVMGITSGGGIPGREEGEKTMEIEQTEEQKEQQCEWAKVLGRKVKQVVKESLDDKAVQKKSLRVTDEAKDRLEREKNIVIRGWKGMEEKGMTEEEMKDSVKVANGITSQVLRVKAEVKEAEWMGKEERKVLLIKMKKWEEKKEIMGARKNLKGTMIFMEDDLTKKEREIQEKLLKIRKDIKAKNKNSKVWVRLGKIAVNEKWYSLEEAERTFRKPEEEGKEK